jgi:hypothetical protein
MTLPDKPAGCNNPEGLGIPNPADKRLPKAIAQARTLAIDEESVLEFPTPTTSPQVLPTPAFSSSAKPLAPLIGGITLVTKDKWSA